MAEMRVGRGWSAREMRVRLEALRDVERSFPESHVAEMSEEAGWRPECSQSVVGCEPPGPPVEGGLFERARVAVAAYEFADPDIVGGHYVADTPLEGRRMLLEIRVLGLRYLCGTVVTCVDTSSADGKTTWGYRYDTLAGHLECGAEWFELVKDHASGEVAFRIRSWWRNGDFPNWWSRVGFDVLSPYYRKLWLERAHERVRVRALGLRPDADARPESETLLGAAALGTLAGMRSMSAPALMAWSAGTAGPQRGATLLERSMAAPPTAAALTIAALGEMAADKHPAMPPRTDPPALVGRLVSGALSAATLAVRRRHNPWTAGAIGAAAAGVSTFAAYHLRKRLAAQGRIGSATLGFLEDAVVAAGVVGLALTPIASVKRQERELQKPPHVPAAPSEIL